MFFSIQRYSAAQFVGESRSEQRENEQVPVAVLYAKP